MGLRYAVITSVTRDDLPDGGAGHFVRVIEASARREPRNRRGSAGARFSGRLDGPGRCVRSPARRVQSQY